MENVETNNCPTCNQPMLDGQDCPSCLMAMGMNNDDLPATTASSSYVSDEAHAPPIEKLVKEFPGLEIQHLIGHGGMGAVYQARQINLDRIVALKVLSPRLRNDPTFPERFLREARAMAKLSHPNIATIFDFGQAGDYYFLTMEFVDGVNLRETIHAGHLTSTDALAIVPQICDALQYAHDNGIVHRDIKPENILIAKNGSVRIVDFGLAKLLDRKSDDLSLTGTRQILGTLSYMAPEQIEKSENVDHRADLYSLGVVFYELLTGELPIGRFALPSEKTSNVSQQLDDVVLRTLEKDPNRRFQQASEIKTACESAEESSETEPAAATVENSNAAAPPLPKPIVNQPEENVSIPICPAIPITIDDVYGGMATGMGFLRGFDTHLELEFEIEDAIFSAVKTAVKKVEIPLERITKIQISPSWLFWKKLQIQTDNVESVREIPNSSHGKFNVAIKKADIAAAEVLVEQVSEIRGFSGKPSLATAMNTGDQPAQRKTNWGLIIVIAVLAPILMVTCVGLAGVALLTASTVVEEPTDPNHGVVIEHTSSSDSGDNLIENSGHAQTGDNSTVVASSHSSGSARPVITLSAIGIGILLAIAFVVITPIIVACVFLFRRKRE